MAIKKIMCCCGSGLGSSMLVRMNVEKVLNLDTSKYRLSVVVPFGYRINPQSTQMRLSFDEVVEYIK